MRVLVHEWVTGGGLAGEPLPPSWAAEGRAMRLAIADDFHCLAGVEVVMTLDERFSEHGPWETVPVAPGREEETLALFAPACDYTALIAPETGGVLAARAELIARAGGCSLGSSPPAIDLTTDKLRLFEHLELRGIKTPRTSLLKKPGELPPDYPYPVILKPRDGAGAMQTHILEGPREAAFFGAFPDGMIVQPFCRGEPLSATFLVGASGGVRLVAVGRQRITTRDGTVAYHGGRLPVPSEFALGAPVDAVRSVEGLRGLLGVDFVRDDRTGETTVIEINPRPTTSYVGLRHLLPPGALARAWLDAMGQGPEGDDLRGMIQRAVRNEVWFEADGTVHKKEGAADDGRG